jgi:uncharacterized protein YraI
MKILTTTALLCAIALPAIVQVDPAYSNDVSETRTYGKVCTVERGSSLSLRSGPGKNYRVLTTIRDGSSLPLIKNQSGSDGFKWWLTKTNGRRGWVRADYICNISVDWPC